MFSKIHEHLSSFFKHKNILIRTIFVLIAIYPLIHIREFAYTFYLYLSGNEITRVVTEQWHVVVVSILIFIAFLIPLSYRRKANWAEYGLVTAFFVSLFIEMYGIPLTILFASKYFYSPKYIPPENLIHFNFLGVGLGMYRTMAYGAFLMILGAIIIITAWITLYRNIKKGKGLVASGIYEYSRHPQYFGFILIILGWFIGWPTILTLIFTPILLYKYISVCFKEEKELIKKHPKYKKYKSEVPFFI